MNMVKKIPKVVKPLIEEPPDWPKATTEELDAQAERYLKSETFLYNKLTDEQREASKYGKDYGNVAGVPLAVPMTYTADQITTMSHEQLKCALISIQEIYWDTRVKLAQYRANVPDHMIRRDPSVGIRIPMLLSEGKTDRQIAEDVNEKPRFIQGVRLDVNAKPGDKSPLLKRQRGRKRKDTDAP